EGSACRRGRTRGYQQSAGEQPPEDSNVETSGSRGDGRLARPSRAQLGSLPDCQLISELQRSKDARSIGRKLNHRHARIPAIEIFILAEKSIASPQILRVR